MEKFLCNNAVRPQKDMLCIKRGLEQSALNRCRFELGDTIHFLSGVFLDDLCLVLCQSVQWSRMSLKKYFFVVFFPKKFKMAENVPG